MNVEAKPQLEQSMQEDQIHTALNHELTGHVEFWPKALV
jgi:hypothetical protein